MEKLKYLLLVMFSLVATDICCMERPEKPLKEYKQQLALANRSLDLGKLREAIRDIGQYIEELGETRESTTTLNKLFRALVKQYKHVSSARGEAVAQTGDSDDSRDEPYNTWDNGDEKAASDGGVVLLACLLIFIIMIIKHVFFNAERQAKEAHQCKQDYIHEATSSMIGMMRTLISTMQDCDIAIEEGVLAQMREDNDGAIHSLLAEFRFL